MSNTKLHPSIVLYVRNRFDDYEQRYYLGTREIAPDDVAQVSTELWEVTLTQESKPTRKPRSDEWEW